MVWRRLSRPPVPRPMALPFRSTVPRAVAPRLAPALAALVVAGTACSHDPIAAPAAGAAPRAAVAAAQAYVPGTAYFGTNDYVEYLAGDLPVIFSAPHGGSLRPGAIPAREAGAACGPDVTTVLDANTQDLARRIQQAFFNRTGRYPHVVINRLHRDRLDANRPVGEAACGNADAIRAWEEYHGFIDAAKAAVLASAGRGWYTDVHGHGHAVPRLELGYELSGTTLRRSDAELDATATYESQSSIRTFSQASPLSFSQLLRGPTALGTLLGDAGYPSVPSQQDPAPDVGESYFNGGYSTDRHACSNGGAICGVQIEANNAGVRDFIRHRSSFASAIAAVYAEFLAPLGIALPGPAAPGPGQPLVIDDENLHNDWARARYVASVDSWGTNNSNSQSYGTDFSLGSVSPGATDDAEFRFHAATPGTYAIDAWWPATTGRSNGAVYQVYAPGSTTPAATVTRSQRTNGARWNALATVEIAEAGWARVVLSRSLSANTGSLAADAVRATLVEGAQTIAFTSAPPAPGLVGRTYAVAASATSGRAPTFASLTPAVCTTSGAVVALVGAGTCTIAADEAGGDGWRPAPRATQTFAVEMARVAVQPATISLATTSAITVTVFGSAAFDAAQLAPATTRVRVVGGTAAGAPIAQRAGAYSISTRDADGDGRLDRVFLVNRSDLVAAGLSLANTRFVVEDLVGAARFQATPVTNPVVGP